MLTEQELEIVHALQEAPRASWAVLGSVLAADPRTVARDYTRLVDCGIVRLTAVPGPKLLQHLQFGHLRLRAAPGRVATVAAQLSRWPLATTVRITDGSFDVHALVVGIDHQSLLRAVHDTVAGLPDVTATEVSTALRTVDVGQSGRLNSLSSTQVRTLRTTAPAASHSAPVRLTAGDFEIMRVLTCDGRTEISELSRRLDREPSTLSRRVARLRADGYLDFLAVTTDTASSFPVIAFLWCTATPPDLDTLAEHLTSQPWLGSFTITSGQSNACVVAHLQTTAALGRIVDQLAAMAPSLHVNETQFAGYAVKLYNRWLDAHDRFTDDLCDPYPLLAGHFIERVT